MEKEKHVDESWKEQASQEKDSLAGASHEASDSERIITNEPVQEVSQEPVEQPQASKETNEQAQSVEVNFLNYVTSLGFQAMIFMGEIPNPVTNETERNLVQAKFLIDTMAMLKEKTEGNLSDQEKDFLKNSVYELQMRYVQVSQNESSSDEEKNS